MQEVSTVFLLWLTRGNVHSDYIKATFPLVGFFLSGLYLEATLTNV
jgi:hypothetical protein